MTMTLSALIFPRFVTAVILSKKYFLSEESVIFRRIADYVNRVLHLADYLKELHMTNIYHVIDELGWEYYNAHVFPLERRKTHGFLFHTPYTIKIIKIC